MPLSRLDLPRIVEAIRELYRIIENSPTEPWQPPQWLIARYERRHKGASHLWEIDKPLHSWLINEAREAVLDRIMPPYYHTKADCPEITESQLDQRHKLKLIELRKELVESFDFGGQLANNGSTALLFLSFLENVLNELTGELPKGTATDRDQGGAVPAEEGAESNKEPLKPAREKAYRLFRWAMEQKPELKTDRDVYDWLDNHPDVPEELPIFATWSRHLRGARAYYEDHKHTPRTTKTASGKSVVRRDQI